MLLEQAILQPEIIFDGSCEGGCHGCVFTNQNKKGDGVMPDEMRASLKLLGEKFGEVGRVIGVVSSGINDALVQNLEGLFKIFPTLDELHLSGGLRGNERVTNELLIKIPIFLTKLRAHYLTLMCDYTGPEEVDPIIAYMKSGIDFLTRNPIRGSPDSIFGLTFSKNSIHKRDLWEECYRQLMSAFIVKGSHGTGNFRVNLESRFTDEVNAFIESLGIKEPVVDHLDSVNPSVPFGDIVRITGKDISTYVLSCLFRLHEPPKTVIHRQQVSPNRVTPLVTPRGVAPHHWRHAMSQQAVIPHNGYQQILKGIPQGDISAYLDTFLNE